MATQVQRWLSSDSKEFHTEVEANAHDATVSCLRTIQNKAAIIGVGGTENAAVYNVLFVLFKTGTITLPTNRPAA